MKFNFVLAALLGIAQADPIDIDEVRANHGSYSKDEVQNVLDHIDFASVADKMEYEMKQALESKEFAQKLQSQIAMDAAVLVQEQLALDDKWRSFDSNIFSSKNQFETMQLHKKVQAILESLQKDGQMEEMFG